MRLCGPLLVEMAGRRIDDALPSRQGRLVFAYLALHRTRPVRRDELVDALWPARAPVSADGVLTSVLSRLRHALPPGTLQGRGQLSLELGPKPWIDVEVAEGAPQRAQQALESGKPAEALSVARSALEILRLPLLPELERPWVDEHRRHLEHVELSLLDLIARLGLAGGASDLAAAERAARTLIEREPLRESAHALLMEALAARGDVANALQVYDELRRRLRDELGTVPAAPLRALSERLVRADEPSTTAEHAEAPQPTPPLPRLLMRDAPATFVGRSDELAVLQQGLDHTADGHPRAVLLEGEPGIGKTRLATEFARRAHADGAWVLYGRCHEEALGSYHPFVEALTPLIETTPPEALRRLLGPAGGELARLLPELTSRVPDLPAPIVDSEGERLRLFAAVAGLLSAASGHAAVVLVLDDLHWMDRPSAALLGYLVRASNETRLLIVGTSRDTELDRTSAIDAVLAKARHEGRSVQVTLRGLSPAELETLVSADAPGREATQVSAALFARTAGNPFFARELLRHLSDTGGEDGGIPLGVRQAIEWRLERLSESTQRTLTLAALLGPDIRSDVLKRVAGLDERALVDVLDEAVRAGLLVEAAGVPGSYGWRHALISETLVEALTAARRAHHHHQIASALEQHDRDAHLGEIAHHFLSAAPLAGTAAQARAYAIRAAEAAAARLAHDETARLLRIARAALDLESLPPEQERVDVLLALGDAELRAGDAESSRDTYTEAIAAARRIGDPERLARAALGSAGGRPWSGIGMSDDALRAVLEEALAVLDREDSALRARVLSRLATELYWSAGRRRGVSVSREALAMARRVGDPEALAASLYAAYAFHDGPDSLELRVALAAEMRALAEKTGDPNTQAWADHFTVIEALERGEIALADEALRRYVDLAATLRHPLHRWHAELWTAMRRLLAGRLDEAEQHILRAYALGQRAKDPNALQTVQLQLATLRWEQGRGGELLAPLEDAARTDQAVPAWHTALAHLYAELDRNEEARPIFERVAADDFSLLPRDSTWIGALANLAETCAYLGDVARAETLARLLEPYADRVVVVAQARVCMGAAAYYLGILADTRGDHAEAIRHLEAALELNERLGARPRLAYTRRAYGQALLARGRPEDLPRAGDLLDQAASDAEALGMRRLSDRVQRLDRKRVVT